MRYLLSIDPGMSTGITLGHYDDYTPYDRDAFWQVEGGIDGFEKWRDDHYDPDFGRWFQSDMGYFAPTIVCERFIPLASDRAFRIDELEPIRIEGAIRAWGHDVIWQRAACQVLSGGDTPAIRKKRSNEVLRRGGLWLTGKKDLGQKDANDVISAQKHALYYLMFTLNHRPTLDKYGALNAD